MQNIVLIGFMGCGKSTVGKALAKDLKRFYIDSDEAIKKVCGKEIAQIFKDEGEEYFRKMEWEFFHSFKGARNLVISCGGGFLSLDAQIKELGRVVFLKQDFYFIKKSLSPQALAKRPLFKGNAKELFDKRAPLYEAAADLVFDCKQMAKKQIAKALLKQL